MYLVTVAKYGGEEFSKGRKIYQDIEKHFNVRLLPLVKQDGLCVNITNSSTFMFAVEGARYVIIYSRDYSNCNHSSCYL